MPRVPPKLVLGLGPLFLGGAQIHLQKMAAWGPLIRPELGHAKTWFVPRGSDSSCLFVLFVLIHSSGPWSVPRGPTSSAGPQPSRGALLCLAGPPHPSRRALLCPAGPWSVLLAPHPSRGALLCTSVPRNPDSCCGTLIRSQWRRIAGGRVPM